MSEHFAPKRGPAWLHPASPNFRWVFLGFLCFLTFGSYWCYDIPSALENILVDQNITSDHNNHYHFSSSEYSALYAVYNFMNIGFVLVGGYFIDRIGLRIGAVLFCFFIALGQVVVSIGSSLDTHSAFVVMVLGRIIFSLGGESLSVAQSTFCSKWFKGKDLAFSFGITLSFARVGSFTNLVVTPKLGYGYSVPTAMWFGTLTCLVSLGMTVLASTSDKIRDNSVKTENVSAATPIHVRDVLHFPASVWLIYLICVFYYIGVFTLISISGQQYFLDRYGFAPENIGTVLGIPYVMSACLAPFLGYAVDKVGRKPVWLLLCSAIISIAYAVLLFMPADIAVWSPLSFKMYLAPLLGMMLMGFSYSLCAASLWPCIPLLVEERMVGTAYGIMNAIQNGGLAVAAIAVGAASEGSNIKRPLYILFAVGAFTFVCCILLLIYDLSHGKKLTMKSSEVKTEPNETQPLLLNDDSK